MFCWEISQLTFQEICIFLTFLYSACCETQGKGQIKSVCSNFNFSIFGWVEVNFLYLYQALKKEGKIRTVQKKVVFSEDADY